MLQRYDLRERLGDIETPTLFLASDRDHLVPSVERGRYMADRVPRATVRVLHGHGHICLIAPHLDLGEILDEWTAATRNCHHAVARALPARAAGPS